jgi:hypothetical protein
MMAPFVALVASLLVAANSQGFLSNGADASQTYHGNYNKFITPSLQHVKHGNGPDALSHHNNPAEHGPATYEDKKAESRVVENVLAKDSNSHLGLSAIAIAVLTFASAFAVRMRRVFQPAAVMTTGGASDMLLPASADNIVELESQGSAIKAAVQRFDAFGEEAPERGSTLGTSTPRGELQHSDRASTEGYDCGLDIER